jgi:ABC-type Fe3+/spermidine/putrescine transport system ATPase subunit
MIRVMLDGLVKRFDRVAVVDGASLEIQPGELLVVSGPSGAGKTTLARLIAGLEQPDQGEIFFDGRVMQTVPAAKRRVGLLFQDDALWPHLSVSENVAYGLRVQGISRRERKHRVAEALDLARIGSLGHRRPDQLSGLQRQRAALARALVIEPELLILDEPLGMLETRVRTEFREEIRRIHSEAETTTLVFTHAPREALALADRLAIMDLGRIVQAGPPFELYNRPSDPFVAQFLGQANLLTGQVEGTDSRGESVVRTPIGRLVGQTPNGPLPDGTPVTVAIRPESLSLGPYVAPDSNRFVATLERQVFLGELRQMHLLGPSDHPILALALQSQSDHLRDGQSLTVSVPPELVVVLPNRYRNREGQRAE